MTVAAPLPPTADPGAARTSHNPLGLSRNGPVPLWWLREAREEVAREALLALARVLRRKSEA